jgi:hypothetical protein
MIQANNIEDLIRWGYRIYSYRDFPKGVKTPDHLYVFIDHSREIVIVKDKHEN